MQFGPISRMPVSRAIFTRAAWRAMPSAPASAKPVEMMTQEPTPAIAASLTLWTSASAGTARMATSGGAGTARDGRIGLVAHHLAPPRIDGIDLARESVADEEAHDAPAELVRAVEAPKTATDRG